MSAKWESVIASIANNDEKLTAVDLSFKLFGVKGCNLLTEAMSKNTHLLELKVCQQIHLFNLFF